MHIRRCFRTALVGIGSPGSETPVLCVELESGGEPGSPNAGNYNAESAASWRDENFRREREAANRDPARIFRELREMALRYPHTQSIRRFILHRSFPVDIRHNSKIFREKLRDWVTRHQRNIVIVDFTGDAS